jgi:phosphoserine phosphatase
LKRGNALKTEAAMNSQTYANPSAQTSTMRPLCVDLDGTLVKSDTLIDSLLLLVRTHPLVALRTPVWVMGGKAAFKERVTSVVALDVANLPYNRPLLAYLQEQHEEGRRLYLATGADDKIARRIAEHLGIFDGVLASDGHTNLTGYHKLASLRERFQDGFDYVGNARPDMPLLAGAIEPMVANPDRALTSRLKAENVVIARRFEDRRPLARAIVKAIRPHQWAKNVLLLLPLLLSHNLGLHLVAQVALAFVCFSLTASATYLVNDLLDIEADRRHPKKRTRPFAAGDLPAATGLGLAFVFLALAVMGAWFLPVEFFGLLLGYLAMNLSYSLFLKRVALVDVLLLSGLYAIRLLAGGAAVHVVISPWLAGFSIFLFLSLAIVKRFSELQNVRARGHVPSSARGYQLVVPMPRWSFFPYI